jgi:glycosyltransferase involved in cell wall biosynthesis
VPVFKVEQHIESCIRSIIAQTYKGMELILVDDCSPDNSTELAQALLEQHNFPVYTIIKHTRNRGLSAARNTGLAAANGELVLFIDSDDTVEPTMLEEMAALQQEHDADIVVCNALRIFMNETQPAKPMKSTLVGLVDSATAVKAILTFKEKAYVWKNLYRKSLFDTIKFTENVYYEDSIIQPLLWKEARKLYFHPKALYNYLKRSNSITAQLGQLTNYEAIPDCFREMEENFSKDVRVSGELRASLLRFTYTWIRNLTLTISASDLPYDQLEPTLQKYRGYIKSTNLLRINGRQDKLLPVFLTILKVSPYLYWRRFSSRIAKSPVP